MRLASPYLLWWLWALVPLAFGIFLARQRKKKILSEFADPALLTEILDNYDQRKSLWKFFLMMSVFLFGILSLARPQWGFEWQEVKRKGIDILLCIDTSKSMLTDDVKPNRLERAKWAVKDLLKKIKGDRVGLIAFSGEAYLVCPLTVDFNGFQLSLEDLDTGTIPLGGTNLAKAIEEAIKEYGQTPSQYRAVVILTDGEELEGDTLSWAKKAKQKGIKIYTVGIGTQEGELIRVKNDLGEEEFLKDTEGNFVKSSLNEKVLQEIALITGGIYVRSSGAQYGLDLIYEKEISKMEKRDIDEKMEKRHFERFQIPLALACFLLMIETCISICKRR